MKIRNLIWKIAIVLMVAPLCTSCSDENDEVMSNAKYYLTTTVYPSAYYRASLSLRLKDNTVTINQLASAYTFVAASTRQAVEDIELSVSNRDELVDSYNAANGTEYNVLPADNYSFTKNKVIIKRGESTSQDTITMSLKNVKSLIKEGGYLLPIKITSIEGGNSQSVSSNRGVVYVKVDNVHINVEAAQPTEGTIIANRSSWAIKVAPTTRESADRLIDGNTGTDVARDGGAEYWITVDLAKVQTLTGIKVQCYGTSYSPKEVEVYTSTDGQKWKSMGTTATSGSTQYIKFTNAVETRYLKYYITKGPSTVSLTEFNLYAK